MYNSPMRATDRGSRESRECRSYVFARTPSEPFHFEEEGDLSTSVVEVTTEEASSTLIPR